MEGIVCGSIQAPIQDNSSSDQRLRRFLQVDLSGHPPKVSDQPPKVSDQPPKVSDRTKREVVAIVEDLVKAKTKLNALRWLSDPSSLAHIVNIYEKALDQNARELDDQPSICAVLSQWLAKYYHTSADISVGYLSGDEQEIMRITLQVLHVIYQNRERANIDMQWTSDKRLSAWLQSISYLDNECQISTTDMDISPATEFDDIEIQEPTQGVRNIQVSQSKDCHVLSEVANVLLPVSMDPRSASKVQNQIPLSRDPRVAPSVILNTNPPPISESRNTTETAQSVPPPPSSSPPLPPPPPLPESRDPRRRRRIVSPEDPWNSPAAEIPKPDVPGVHESRDPRLARCRPATTPEAENVPEPHFGSQQIQPTVVPFVPIRDPRLARAAVAQQNQPLLTNSPSNVESPHETSPYNSPPALVCPPTPMATFPSKGPVDQHHLIKQYQKHNDNLMMSNQQMSKEIAELRGRVKRREHSLDEWKVFKKNWDEREAQYIAKYEAKCREMVDTGVHTNLKSTEDRLRKAQDDLSKASANEKRLVDRLTQANSKYDAMQTRLQDAIVEVRKLTQDGCQKDSRIAALKSELELTRQKLLDSETVQCNQEKMKQEEEESLRKEKQAFDTRKKLMEGEIRNLTTTNRSLECVVEELNEKMTKILTENVHLRLKAGMNLEIKLPNDIATKLFIKPMTAGSSSSVSRNGIEEDSEDDKPLASLVNNQKKSHSKGDRSRGQSSSRKKVKTESSD